MKNVKGGEIKIDLLKREREREREMEMVMVEMETERFLRQIKQRQSGKKSVCERWRWKEMDRLSVYLDKFAKQERLNNEKKF